MSASLVGSEMCIRDSARTNGRECTPPELQGPMLRPFLGPSSSRFERLGPVSYTHLTLPTICSV
eukprot:5972659-Alexandrium_andersonii.AAC.1